jgi:hypothetical protein
MIHGFLFDRDRLNHPVVVIVMLGLRRRTTLLVCGSHVSCGSAADSYLFLLQV